MLGMIRLLVGVVGCFCDVVGGVVFAVSFETLSGVLNEPAGEFLSK